ncbi:uncharacterized protein LOC114935400 [Nylanderia fulva]|uniref:uncharacterized protein LOC114935400 n=1 Tax=Nylanderia fulva TaxID=613905 RepID=UPI0010FAE827|nr:uncharacterized protein LOC114935400 [Nylanderia fulva]
MEQKNLRKKIVSEARFKFALTSLHKYATIKPKKYIVFSPYNIYHGLYSAYLISSGEMEQRLKEILYLPADVSKNELMNIINFNNPAKRPENYMDSTFYMPYHYVIKNQCIFLNKKLPGDIKTKEELYNIEIKSIISNNIHDTNRELNEILQSLIKDHFRKPVNLKVQTEDMDIFLASIHNFKGRNQIVSQSTSGSTDAPSLSTPSYLKIKTFSSDELQVDVKELIIKEHFTSLYMLIPFSSSTNKKVKTNTSSTNLSSLIKKLSTSEGMDILRELLSRVRTLEPLSFATRSTFEIENNLNMRPLLRKLGVERLLTPEAIPLDNTFVKIDQSAHFGNAVHRARVKVTQKDVKAAAVTVISGQKLCSNDIITDMDFKNPFLWFIYDKMNADILYIGVFNEVHMSVSERQLTGTNQTHQTSCSF